MGSALLREDQITGRQVIFPGGEGMDLERWRVRPWEPQVDVCSFCEGHESMTPPEILAPRRKGTARDGPGWMVRVVPNRYPALVPGPVLGRRRRGFYETMPGRGAHEVIIESPQHGVEMEDLRPAHLGLVLRVWCDRFAHHARNPKLKYALIFKNHGASAGASVIHSHAQFIALPFIPQRAQDEYEGSRRYYERHDRCYYCDVASGSSGAEKRIMHRNGGFLALSPAVPGHPFEILILPEGHESDFVSLTDKGIRHLSEVLKALLVRLKKRLKSPSYNLLLHSAPLGRGDKFRSFHWHIEILPRLIRSGGFEWATHVHLNPVAPERAAFILGSHSQR